MTATPATLLAPVGTVAIAETSSPCVAADRFIENAQHNAAVKISYLDDDFKVWFLGKSEEPFTGSMLRYGKLSHHSTDGPILKELGGEEKAETTLTELLSLIEKQPNGESGPLLVNGYSNIFYIKDVRGDLRAVHALWHGDGWDLLANAVGNQIGSFGVGHVFSRDSR